MTLSLYLISLCSHLTHFLFNFMANHFHSLAFSLDSHIPLGWTSLAEPPSWCFAYVVTYIITGEKILTPTSCFPSPWPLNLRDTLVLPAIVLCIHTLSVLNVQHVTLYPHSQILVLLPTSLRKMKQSKEYFCRLPLPHLHIYKHLHPQLSISVILFKPSSYRASCSN